MSNKIDKLIFLYKKTLELYNENPHLMCDNNDNDNDKQLMVYFNGNLLNIKQTTEHIIQTLYFKKILTHEPKIHKKHFNRKKN